MSRAQDLKPLHALSAMVLDHRLQALRAAAEDLARSRSQLQGINAAAPSDALDPVVAGLVDVSYQRWADVRRTELNQTIARQSATWIEARAEAGAAFGRVQALAGLSKRMDAKG